MNLREITVIKRNASGIETWRYQGRVLYQDAEALLLEARFNRADLQFHGILFKEGDRFVEVYFSDRWYNIYEIYDRDNGALKGWYCNVSMPAVFDDGGVSFVDLALDLLVYPDGRQLALDVGEFEQLNLPEAVQQQARAALSELQTLVVIQTGFRLERWVRRRGV